MLERIVVINRLKQMAITNIYNIYVFEMRPN